MHPTLSLSLSLSLSLLAYVQYGPHFQTFDGKMFDFDGDGDFVVLETDAFNLFTVQNRGAILPFAPQQTFNIAFAFGLPDLAFQVNK